MVNKDEYLERTKYVAYTFPVFFVSSYVTADRFIEERVNTEGPRITLGKVGGGTLTRKQSGPLVSSLVRRQNEVSHGANKLARFSSVTWSPGVAARKLKLSR